MTGPRRPREIIEKLPGGFLIDVEGNRSIETPEMVAGLIIRIWPQVADRIVWLREGIEHGTTDQESPAAEG